ncbi:hypothetical protein O6V14_18845 [Sphingomonas faeni]|uniref:hypothetical protein n=1 Tax=Sphingomonas faeni TaxID=185950 RepID=UPI0033447783
MNDRTRPEIPYDHVWRSRLSLRERTGHPLRILAVGSMNMALIEFEDGVRHFVDSSAFRARRYP